MQLSESIKGKRIYFRTLTENDASERYCKWLNDPTVNKYLETRKATIESLKKYINEKNEAENCLFLGIFDKKYHNHIGNIKLEPIDYKNNRATFGILIGDKDYWGKSIGEEAAKLLVDYAFEKLDIRTIDLGVISENKPAIRLYEKVGFKIVDIEKNKVKHDNIFL